MKYWIPEESENAAIGHHLQKEGIDKASCQEQADLIIGVDKVFPRAFVEQLLGPLSSGKDLWFLTRVFNGREFLEQTIVGVPLQELFDNGLGASVASGSVIGFCEPIEHLRLYFNKLIPTLIELKYKGLVSIVFSENDEPTFVHTNAGHYALYAVLECLNINLADWITKPTLLKESWVCSLLLSRFPFPWTKTANTIAVHINPSAEKHLWLFHDQEAKMFRDTFRTSSTRIAVATAWARESLSRAVVRAENTLRRIELPEKQFRTDGRRLTRQVISRLLSKELLHLTVPWTDDDIIASERASNAAGCLESVEQHV